MRITDNGTNRITYISNDGYYWHTLSTIGRTDYITANQYGFFIGGNNSAYLAMHLLHFVVS